MEPEIEVSTPETPPEVIETPEEPKVEEVTTE